MRNLLISILVLMSSNAFAEDRSRQVWQENTSQYQNKMIVSKHVIKNDEQLGHVIEMNGVLFDPYYMKCYSKTGPCSCDDKDLDMVKLMFTKTEKVVPAHDNTVIIE